MTEKSQDADVERHQAVSAYHVSARATELYSLLLQTLVCAALVYFACTHRARPASALCLLIALAIPVRQARLVRKESLIALRGIGVQLSAQTWLGTRVTFVDATDLSAIVLLESIRGWTIIWTLAVIEQRPAREARIHVAFKHSLPLLATLTPIWRGSRSTMEMSSKRHKV
ncbi:uncharacterized protein L969DRAFT_65124 [Mixia osmundae IAM 14324]|uniref:Phosphatidylinositol N-acetylglucosaminyltransferase subunit H conserved domain-containing protein n=1 Tax=Mixia osmundae (strain CBS 9802 / IAM 14324 / JCM 22182 / KY 12970) TaxID=764103 RepID=G7DS90_MIXOS|nr:uncharacterized protein L969DRAFT_65124 [Mixia osmundae IAM 14324]KEI37497.1 hypothetical protein L969DRAFT_65124 [Mixia osmundae IAM 14324]GAA93450.1 hypothetical protein E5Q_00091 [Mixia osmundae IAM 14324]